VRLRGVIIKNFRNFKSLDVKLGELAVILGENKVGKTNLLFALRLILAFKPADYSIAINLHLGQVDWYPGVSFHAVN